MSTKPKRTVPLQKADASIAQGKSVLKASVRLPSGHTIEVVLADMTHEKTTAVVNAANTHLKHHGGLAAALVAAGGKVIQKESDAHIKKFGHVSTGTCISTSAGALPCKYVLHCVGPVYRDGRSGEPELLAQSIDATLALAEQLQCQSISCPAISSGIFGFPRDLCAAVVIDATVKYFAAHPTSCLQVVRMVNFDSETTGHFEREMAKRFGDGCLTASSTVLLNKPAAASAGDEGTDDVQSKLGQLNVGEKRTAALRSPKKH